MAGEHVPHQALHDAQEAVGAHPLHGRMRRRLSGGAGHQVLLHLHEQVDGGRAHRAFDGCCPAAGFDAADEQPISRLGRRREPGIRQRPAGRTGQAQTAMGGIEFQGGVAPWARVGQRTAVHRADHEAAKGPGGAKMDLGADSDILADTVRAPSRSFRPPETRSWQAQPGDCSGRHPSRRLQGRVDAEVCLGVQPTDGRGG